MKNKITHTDHRIRVRDTQGNISYIDCSDSNELVDIGDSEHTDIVDIDKKDKRFDDFGGKPY